MNIKSLALALITIPLFYSCDSNTSTKTEETKTQVDSTEVARLNQWFADIFERNLMDYPQFLTRLGRKDRQGELNDISEAQSIKDLEEAKNDLSELLKFNINKLDEQTKLSFRLYKRRLEREIKYDKYRHYSYPVNQMHGIQSELPSFILNMHQIENKEDAEAYVSRLNAIKPLFDQLIENLKIRSDKGIIVPKFVFGHLYNDCNNIIGDPKKVNENLFIKDLTGKLAETELTEEDKKEIIIAAENAVTESVIVAYQNLVTYLKELEQLATTDDGVWKFEDGENFYNYRLEEITTTTLTSDEIFNTGKAEVERIHNEMKAIMKQVNFEGSLQDFFKFMKEDQQFYYADGAEGKAKMLAGYQAIVDSMEAHLDEVFYTKPKAKMEVKAVEEWREKSAGKAFYQRGTPDGTRKGTFYANLYKMADMPTYEMEALAYHEGIPGHHMQGSIAQELTDLPEFRKYSGYTSYSEGWGLYCELLPKDMGFYQDPYSDFGRLAMELWRACRLVVDAGIHQKRWTREKAIAYLMENTPNSENSCTKAIERYIVMPGQATAYKVGMLHILKMREKAKNALGDKFDIRKFHDIFLRSGGVPLEIFEEQIDEWIAKETL
tara:strand:- start:1059 stop:2879 length:1821 start_codon:yes stop_codon:yes gene_type:complete